MTSNQPDTDYSSDCGDDGDSHLKEIVHARSLFAGKGEENLVSWAARLQLELSTLKSCFKEYLKSTLLELEKSLKAEVKALRLSTIPTKPTADQLDEIKSFLEKTLREQNQTSSLHFANSELEQLRSRQAVNQLASLINKLSSETVPSIVLCQSTVISKLEDRITRLEAIAERTMAVAELSLAKLKRIAAVLQDAPKRVDALEDQARNNLDLVTECVKLLLPRIVSIEQTVTGLCEVLDEDRCLVGNHSSMIHTCNNKSKQAPASKKRRRIRA